MDGERLMDRERERELGKGGVRSGEAAPGDPAGSYILGGMEP